MPKFRKRPVVISAEQYLPAKTPYPAGVVPLPERMRELNIRIQGAMWIETLEGGHVVSPGDYIITGVKGERYPCKPDIFEATYESVPEGE
jgi:hypothetical protein